MHSSQETAIGTTSVTIKVDESTKQPMSAMAEDFGFGISSIARAFYKQAERGQGIPLSVEYPEPNNESPESIRKAEKIIAEKRPAMPPRKKCSTPWVRSDCRRRNSPRSSNGTPKWPIQHVRQTVVPNGPKQARKSARNGPFSTHGPPLTPNRALVTHSAPKKLRRNQGIDKLIWNGKPYRALRLGAQPYC